jgi:hypothetical protein
MRPSTFHGLGEQESEKLSNKQIAVKTRIVFFLIHFPPPLSFLFVPSLHLLLRIPFDSKSSSIYSVSCLPSPSLQERRHSFSPSLQTPLLTSTLNRSTFGKLVRTTFAVDKTILLLPPPSHPTRRRTSSLPQTFLQLNKIQFTLQNPSYNREFRKLNNYFK